MVWNWGLWNWGPWELTGEWKEPRYDVSLVRRIYSVCDRPYGEKENSPGGESGKLGGWETPGRPTVGGTGSKRKRKRYIIAERIDIKVLVESTIGTTVVWGLPTSIFLEEPSLTLLFYHAPPFG